MHSKTTTLTLLIAFCASAGAAHASQPDTASMKRVFAKIEKALRGKNEKLFKKQWHEKGYAKNLVGGSGLPGRAVFRQGSRKGWYLKPDIAKMRGVPGRRGGPWIIPCEIYSWKKQRAVDKVWALVAYQRKLKRWIIVGAGEKLAQVEALGTRYVKGKL
ncbi:MAG: hypothetical protein KC503_06345 [Myxococcales bacterium]|nr:hypothetical protein [Myxococcales bacterium]